MRSIMTITLVVLFANTIFAQDDPCRDYHLPAASNEISKTSSSDFKKQNIKKLQTCTFENIDLATLKKKLSLMSNQDSPVCPLGTFVQISRTHFCDNTENRFDVIKDVYITEATRNSPHVIFDLESKTEDFLLDNITVRIDDIEYLERALSQKSGYIIHDVISNVYSPDFFVIEKGQMKEILQH